VIARALETIDPLIHEKHHKVAVVSSRRPLRVNADSERLVQCLANVLTNSAKYTNNGGEIRIESRTDGNKVVISIADNGVGIAPELLPKVFDLFVQAERTLDRSQGGLGIGLSIVKRLIEMHGGTVSVASDGVNRGATFEIRLPLTEATQDAADSEHATSPVPCKILVVDDNRDAADSLGTLLRLDGHDVETAYSGLDALERIRCFRPAVVLLDIGLPGVDGYEVARRLRADPNADGTKLVALTGYGQDAYREEASAAGFVAHLVKPVEYAALQRVIAQVAPE
jgi:CheY-like chemotaxis protein/anti-sigma regulatory factor (Ser/Thr protein kinase)